MLRAAAIAYFALGGFTLFYVAFMFAVTDRGVLGWIMALPVGVALWCLAMGGWSTWLGKGRRRVPQAYGAVGLGVAVGVGAMTSTVVLFALVIPALLGAAATWGARTEPPKL